MDTPRLIRRCGWRFYAGKFLNAALFGRDWPPYAGTMAIKLFAVMTAPTTTAPAIAGLLSDTVQNAYPELAWRFGRIRYEPHKYAYDPSGTLRPFDYRKNLTVDEAALPAATFWEFVEQQCLQDETDPPVFGEPLCVRFACPAGGPVFLRMLFNHALVDGLMIFKFMAAWEAILAGRRAKLESIGLEPGARRREWSTGKTRYYVEDLCSADQPVLARRGFDYLPILYEIARRYPFSRVRQAIALPRDAQVQLTIEPVAKAPGFEWFKRRNAERLRHATSNNRLSRLLGMYVKNADTGDRVMRYLMSDSWIGRQLFSWIAGQVLVSAFMQKHDRYLAFPVVHALQREGIAICATWTDPMGRKARLVGARHIR